MKDEIKYIETKERKYPICFNMNAMEEIQEEYGSISNWISVIDSLGEEPKVKELKAGLMIMINEAIDMENEKKEEKDPFVTSKQVGRIMSEIGIDELNKIIEDVATEATKVDEEPKNE